MGSLVVFHWARAIISPQFLTLLPPGINCASLLDEVTHELDVTVDLIADRDCPALQGKWEDVLQAQVKLIDLLKSWQTENRCGQSTSGTINDVTSYNYNESNKRTISVNITDDVQNISPDHASPEMVKAAIVNELKKKYSVITDAPKNVRLIESSHNVYEISSDCNNIDIIPALSNTVASINETVKTVNDHSNVQQSVKFDNSQIILVKTSGVEHELQNVTENAKDNGELYMDIVLSRREGQPNSESEDSIVRNDDISLKVENRENPLDKLCNWLRIDDEEEQSVNEVIHKPADTFEKKRRYENNMPYRFFCSLCSYKTKRENQHIKHIRLHEKHNVTYICSQCQFTAIRINTLRRHELQHADGPLVSCSKCPYQTNSLKFLQRHKQSKHSRNAPALHCSHCDFKTCSLRELRKHKYVHKSETPKVMYKCNKCSYKTQNKSHLKRHVNNIHELIRPYLCHLCGKSFKRHDTLKQHRVIHGEAGRTFSCPTCSKVCRSSTHLKEHMTVHTTQRPFLCELCGATFKTRSNQCKHIKTMHNAIKLVPCPHCKRTFNTKASMMRHEKTHAVNDSAEPKCPDTSKSFNENNTKLTENAIVNKDIIPP